MSGRKILTFRQAEQRRWDETTARWQADQARRVADTRRKLLGSMALCDVFERLQACRGGATVSTWVDDFCRATFGEDFEMTLEAYKQLGKGE